MAVLATPPFLQFFDENGDPLVGGKVYTYRAGTTEPKMTYTDETEDTPATNPIILDSAGRAVIWISGSYKFVITDADDNIIRTVDNVTSFNVFGSGSDSYFEALSGDGTQVTFALSQDLGTDENAVFVFVDSGMQQHVRNGGFDTNSIWNLGAGWTIGSGVATAAGAISTAISQNSEIPIVQGQAYVTRYTVTRDAGNVTLSLGGTNGTARNSAGTYTEIIVAGASQTIAITGAGFTGTVDNVSVRPVMGVGATIIPPTLFTLNGTSITFAQAPAEGDDNILIFAPSLLVGAAAGAASAAEQYADNAANSAELAESWAVDDIGDRPEGSAKYWAEQSEGHEIAAGGFSDEAESWAVGDIMDRPEGSAREWAQVASAVAIPDGTITNAKMANMAQATFKGRAAGAGTGAPQDLTPAQMRAGMELGTAAVANTGAASGNVPVLDGDGLIPLSVARRMVLSATVSGSPVQLTVAGIPSWAKRITITLDQFSPARTQALNMRVGTSGGMVASGYTSTTHSIYATNMVNSTGVISSSFIITPGSPSGNDLNARGVIELVKMSGADVWGISSTVSARTDAASDRGTHLLADSINVGGTLDRIQFFGTGSGALIGGSVSLIIEG